MTPERAREALIEEAAGAYRPTRGGGPGSHPAWHDLDEAGRVEAHDLAARDRLVEAALDPLGRSTTVLAVLARIRG